MLELSGARVGHSPSGAPGAATSCGLLPAMGLRGVPGPRDGSLRMHSCACPTAGRHCLRRTGGAAAPPTAAGAAGFAKGEHAEANPVGALRSAGTRASARQAPSRIGRRRRKKLRSRAFPRPSRGAPRQRWSKAIPIRPGGGPTEPQASCGGRPRALTFPCIPWTRHRKSCRRCAASR